MKERNLSTTLQNDLILKQYSESIVEIARKKSK